MKNAKKLSKRNAKRRDMEQKKRILTMGKEKIKAQEIKGGYDFQLEEPMRNFIPSGMVKVIGRKK